MILLLSLLCLNKRALHNMQAHKTLNNGKMEK